MKQVSIVDARDHFTELVREVEEQSGVELTRRGKPVAVILSLQEYKQLQLKEHSFWDAYNAFRGHFDLVELGIEPEVFADVRDSSVGRDVLL